MRGVNYRVPALPQFETLDVPYLGTVILDAAFPRVLEGSGW